MDCGRWAHRLVQLALALLLVALAALGALSLRLAEGPLQLDWLARRLTASVNAADPATHLSIGSAAIAWQGLRLGLDSPLELVLHGVALADAHGKSLRLPQAAITLSPRQLLQGRIAVRAVALDGLALHVLRDAFGTTSLDLAGPADIAAGDNAAPAPIEILAALAAPPDSGLTLLGALRRLQIRNSTVSIDDRQLGLAWTAQIRTIDLNRASGGGASGQLALDLRAADPSPPLHLDARVALLPGGGITLAGGLQTVVPSRLASLAPALAPLSAIEAPVGLSGTVTLAPDLALRGATLAATLGSGALHLGTGVMPVQDAAITAEAGPDGLRLTLTGLHLRARPDSELTTVAAHVDARIDQGQIAASAVVDLDQAAFADLPILWPAGIGGPGTRPWVIQNLTQGHVRNAHVALSLTAPTDLSDAKLTHIEGGLDAADVTCWWLRPVPPIEHGAAKLVFVDPDTIDVLATAGRQTGTGLAVQNARVRLTGIAGHDQFMAIDSNLTGPFADVVGVLHHPKIKIIDKLGMPMQHPAGQVAANLTVTMPLKTELNFDMVAIHARGRLADGHLGGAAVGRDVDQAQLDVDVGNDGLHLQGTASVLGVPHSVEIGMDFRSGPPSQVTQRVSVHATVTPSSLSRFGVTLPDGVTGSAAAELSLVDQRDGTGRLVLRADLQRAGFAIAPLDWRKDEGGKGSAELQLRLEHDRVIGVDRLQVAAAGLDLAGTAELSGGRPSKLRVQKLIVGSGTSLAGEAMLPAHDGDPLRLTLHGARLDLSRVFDRSHAEDPPNQPEQRGRPYVIDAQIDSIATGHGQSLTQVAARVETDGLVARSADLRGKAGDGAFTLALAPTPRGRHLTGAAADAGSLLRALDIIADVQGGTMQLDASYDDALPGRPLSGSAEILGFRLRNAPGVARLLQAMSVYGLVEVAQGPGLGFDRLVAPFTLENQVLTLKDARAYSASLGMTAKGSIDMRHKSAAIEGTVVPAYFFNTLPGRLPLLGRLFSPEAGGGLFAASYSIRGSADDPSVSVNPLSMLTPGFLRGFFDMFGAARQGGPPAEREMHEGR